MKPYHHFQLKSIDRFVYVYGSRYSSTLLICIIDADLFSVRFTDPSTSLDIADLTLIRKLMIDIENKRFEIPIKE